MRVAVVGTSGSGKTTFAGRLATVAGLRSIELDVLNWGPGWFDRSKQTPDAFVQSVDEATRGDDWVIAGGYGIVRPLVLSRASDVVWLDLPRARVMQQVIGRSLKRALTRDEVFPGCREDFRKLFTHDHPVRWAWTTHHRRRTQFAAMFADPAYAHARILRCGTRGEVKAAFTRLVSEVRR